MKTSSKSSKNSLPKISIIIPTYNMARFLPICLNSIERQNYPEVEVIIVDGLSTDNLPDIISKYNHLVTHFISEKDNGQADAVTKGLRIASGEIVHWHAADDIILPGAFHRVAQELSDDKVDLVFSDGTALIGNELVKMPSYRWVNFWDTFLFFGRFQSDSAYWKRSITAQALPLDETKPLNCDEDFFLRLWVGNRFKWIPQPLGLFRQHGEQVSQTVSRENLTQDRNSTRKRIQDEQQWSQDYLEKLRRQRKMGFVLRSSVCVKLHSGARYVGRRLTGDKLRKNYTRWLLKDWITN